VRRVSDATRCARAAAPRRAVGDEPLDGLAHRHRAQPERRREVVDHERSAGRETARNDRFAEADEGLLAQVTAMDWG